ncbi:hypothetical protein RFZ01_19610, partial [Acinetobacter pittii]|uniref:hypothetical protein n=1 Tax=Acinetobacter pittii TaxID=48296 RepID=UPI00281294FE
KKEIKEEIKSKISKNESKKEIKKEKTLKNKPQKKRKMILACIAEWQCTFLCLISSAVHGLNQQGLDSCTSYEQN